MGLHLPGVEVLKHRRKHGLVDREHPHLAGHVLDRDANAFAAGRLVEEFHLAHLVGV